MKRLPVNMPASLLWILTLLISLIACSAIPPRSRVPRIGPETTTVPLEKYHSVFFVSQAAGSDQNGDGSRFRPWQSPQFALRQLNSPDQTKRYAILVAAGTYAGETIEMRPHVDLFGGYEPTSWQRDIFRHRTVLTGQDRRRVVIGADHARLDGFVITKGQVRGKGAGVWCDGVSTTITHNTFTLNKTLAPIPWSPKYRHEIGHDGGAVYCENAVAPVIANNLFAENATEVGRGAAIAFHSRCRGRIQNNVFLANRAGLADPMRSSDGGAVSVFEWSGPLIEGNVFLNNRALNENDAGGLFVALWSSPTVQDNLFIGNESTDDAGALFVGGQEHRYDRPPDALPAPDRFHVTISNNLFIGNSNPSRNSGALRFTMEGRGEFSNNLTAHNGGLYFQRCEATISRNVILDNLLLIETKAGLQPCVVKDNVIWGDFDVQTEAALSNNRVLSKQEPDFQLVEEEGLVLIAVGSCFDRARYTTALYITGAGFRSNELAGRAIKAGDRWGMIRSNERRTVSVWGDFSGLVELTVLPRYRKQ
ncbi:MAG: right-handed parallel beta-helix repeat-containing protein [Acidobacteria bacterium]|nr:right-handed parallel beta-helix repeat-containing protein [Acidobacteriota bacterium]